MTEPEIQRGCSYKKVEPRNTDFYGAVERLVRQAHSIPEKSTRPGGHYSERFGRRKGRVSLLFPSYLLSDVAQPLRRALEMVGMEEESGLCQLKVYSRQREHPDINVYLTARSWGIDLLGSSSHRVRMQITGRDRDGDKSGLRVEVSDSGLALHRFGGGWQELDDQGLEEIDVASGLLRFCSETFDRYIFSDSPVVHESA